MKTKLFAGGLLRALLVCGIFATGCGGETLNLGGAEPTLVRIRILGVSAALGTPDANPQNVAPGAIEIESNEANDDGILLLRDVQIAANLSPGVRGSVTWGVSANAGTPPSAYNAENVPVIMDGDYLWVRAAADRNTLYYIIKVTIKLEGFRIAGHPASMEILKSAWDANPVPLAVRMATELAEFEFQWYSNTAFSNQGGALIPGATASSYTPDITALGTYYYYVTIQFEGATLTSDAAMIKIADTLPEAPTEFTIGTTRLNYVRGVGGTGSFMFRSGGGADASPDADVNYIDLLMGTLGANILRIMVQDDYLNYIQNTVQSRNSAQYFHDAERNFFPVIQRVNEAGGYVFANPWTAPANLKTNNNLTGNASGGGHLIETGPAYVAYADHLRGFLKWLYENDAPIFALGILNEPDYGPSAGYEGMGMDGTVTRNWFRVTGHFPTQFADPDTATDNSRGILTTGIIPGYGGGRPTHHVMAQTPNPTGTQSMDDYNGPSIDDTGPDGANNVVEIIGQNIYGGIYRWDKIAGPAGTPWFDRPQNNYTAPYEDTVLSEFPHMYAPGSQPGQVKREVWQTEHDFNFNGSSVSAGGTAQKFWNSVFAPMNDIDWCLRVIGHSVYTWWFSSSYSGFVTSYHPVTGGLSNGSNPNPERTWGPYTITPRGRAFAHYGRYVNETWLLDINRTRGTIDFNNTEYDAGSKTPKISAFEDANGEYISIVMFAPNNSTNTANPDINPNSGFIENSYGQGGLNGSNVPTTGVNVGRIAVVMPEGFTADSAGAIRSYGNDLADGQAWDDVPAGTPRYWINEPAFLSTNVAGRSVVEVTLPGGNIISIKVTGRWTNGREVASGINRRVRPYDQYQNGQVKAPVMREGMTPPVR